MTDPRTTAKEFTDALHRVFGDRLRSVLLYGSVARGEAVPGVSDINILMLLDRVDADALTKASPLARRWSDAGNSVPLIMAWDEWQRASDVFSIELADMRDAHVALHGLDPLEGLEVDPVPLRLQAERELRGKLLQLREGMLVAAEDQADIGRLLLLAVPSFVTYLRAALRLAGRAVSNDSVAVIEAGARLVGGEPDAFLTVWEARRRGEPIRARVDDPLVAGFYALAERTAEYVDMLSEDNKP